MQYIYTVNRGIDFIDLPSIFQDKSVTPSRASSLPDYFQNSEPIIIRNIIFKFNKLVSDPDIDSNTPDS